MSTNSVKLYLARLLPGRVLLQSCYAVAAATCMPAGQVYLLPQTPQLLFQYAYWLSVAARWMLSGSLSLNPAC